MLLKAFTTCVPGILDCISFIKELLGVVKNYSTPFTGGASAMELVVSITTFPSKLFLSASSIALILTEPLVASTMMSANFTVSAKVPVNPLSLAAFYFNNSSF